MSEDEIRLEPEIPAEAAPQPTAEPPKKKKKHKRLGKLLYFVLLAVFATVFVYCAIYIGDYVIESQQDKDAYDELSDLVNQYRDQATDPDATLPTGPDSTDPDATVDPEAPTAGGILPEYQAVYELNPDMIGWITVPDTQIDYPVVQSPDNPNYYLNHNFQKKWSAGGCIYAREQCDVFTPCDNVVLYGHHMKNGSMFAQLDKYKKKAFWEEHQTFTFDTLYEHHTYQVIAVFKTSAAVGQGFSYHIFNTAANEAEFNEFISTVHSLQMYDTGLTAQYGDMLLTLSTCEYTLNEGRFVVVAKRIS